MTSIPSERFLSTAALDLGAAARALGVPTPGPDTSFKDHLREENKLPPRRDDDTTGSATAPAASNESDQTSAAEGTGWDADENGSETAIGAERPADDNGPVETDAVDKDNTEAKEESAATSETADVAASDTGTAANEDSPSGTKEAISAAAEDAVAADEASTSNDASVSKQSATPDGSANGDEAAQIETNAAGMSRASAEDSAPADDGVTQATPENPTLPEGEGGSAEHLSNGDSTTAVSDDANRDGRNRTPHNESAAEDGEVHAHTTSLTRDGHAKVTAEGATSSALPDGVDDVENSESSDDRGKDARKSGREKNASASISAGKPDLSRSNDATANSVADTSVNTASLTQEPAESAPAAAGGDSDSAGINAATSTASADGSPAATAASTPARAPAQLFSRATDGGNSTDRLGDVETTRLVQRVARAFKAAESRGGELRLRLSPPELGTLRIEVRVDAGVMRARLEAETHIARNALLDNLPALRDRLAEQDIRIEQFDVDLMDRHSGDQPENENRRPVPSPPKTTNHAPASSAIEDDLVTDPVPTGTWPTEDKGINVIA